MPSRARVDAFVSVVEQGKFVDALEQFYTHDASMQENNDPPRKGLALLIEGERKVMATYEGARAHHVGPVFIDGDYVVINWVFEFPLPDRRVIRLEELAHQRWSGDKVVEERFFYDPKQMRV